MSIRNELGQFKKGHISPYKGKRKLYMVGKRYSLGLKHSEESRRKMRLAKKKLFESGYIPWNLGQKEQDSHNWKGRDIGYRGLHRWVIRVKGYALKCEWCGKLKTTPKSIHWANKSHEYKRELYDWIQLCATCHKKYDGDYKHNKKHD